MKLSTNSSRREPMWTAGLPPGSASGTARGARLPDTVSERSSTSHIPTSSRKV
jgi:hypothetical protein